MAIELVSRYSPYVDELFTKESKLSLLANNDFDWSGAHTVKVWKINTVDMGDYNRNAEGYGENGSRYGKVQNLGNSTEEFTIRKDRSFTFAIDKLDQNETGDTLGAAAALARQQREVIIPEVDSYVYGRMAAGAGSKPAAVKLTADNIYDKIIAGTEAMDDELVPETGRILVVTPAIYTLFKEKY